MLDEVCSPLSLDFSLLEAHTYCDYFRKKEEEEEEKKRNPTEKGGEREKAKERNRGDIFLYKTPTHISDSTGERDDYKNTSICSILYAWSVTRKTLDTVKYLYE